MHLDGWESVQVHVREKRRWKKYPCAVRGKSFVQFKDNKVCTTQTPTIPLSIYLSISIERSIYLPIYYLPLSLSRAHTHTHTHTHAQCINEVARLPVTEMDVFAGMEKAVRTDHRNPMPTRSGGHQLELVLVVGTN